MKVKYPFSVSFQDYPDNESLAVIVYFYGCAFDCKGCHNPELRRANGDLYFEYTPENLLKDLTLFCHNNKTDKVVFSGGDSLYKDNLMDTKKFLELNSELKVCIYTGNTIETVKGIGLKGVTYIKCGEYKQDLKVKPTKDDTKMEFASLNQKLYDSEYELVSKNNVVYFNNLGVKNDKKE